MPKLLLVLLFLPLLMMSSYAQDRHRYKDHIFEDVTVLENNTYSPDAPRNDKKFYLFDLYQPKDDKEQKRPLIIWMHGGGFKFGSKDSKGIKLWSDDFAKRGYVCAAINYRLSKKNPIFNFDELQKSCFYAVQDVKIAVEYFKQHAAEYRIDPNKIILAGNSAGGMIALQAAYSSNEELAHRTNVKDTTVTLKPDDRIKVAGIINFWGGIFDLNWLKNARVPIVNVYGSEDGIVPPDHKGTGLFGSIAIHQRAEELHIPNQLKAFEGYSHELQKHFNPLFSVGKSTQERWLEAAQFAADFYCDRL